MITAKTHLFWNPQPALEIATEIGMQRLNQAGEVLAAKVRSNLRTIIKNPAYSRPVYKTGKSAGKWWTARDAGEMLKSVRVVSKSIGERNVWVIVGHSKAYYATMFEYATTIKRGKAFFRPAIAASKARMRQIIERGK